MPSGLLLLNNQIQHGLISRLLRCSNQRCALQQRNEYVEKGHRLKITSDFHMMRIHTCGMRGYMILTVCFGNRTRHKSPFLATHIHTNNQLIPNVDVISPSITTTSAVCHVWCAWNFRPTSFGHVLLHLLYLYTVDECRQLQTQWTFISSSDDVMASL